MSERDPPGVKKCGHRRGECVANAKGGTTISYDYIDDFMNPLEDSLDHSPKLDNCALRADQRRVRRSVRVLVKRFRSHYHNSQVAVM